MAGPVINYLAVLVSGILYLGVGMLWYGPLFGKTWMGLMGFNAKTMKSMKMTPAKSMTLAFIAALLMAYVLGRFVDYLDATTFALGAQTGFWIWLGFVNTVVLGSVLWENKPWKLYLLNTTHWLVVLALTGGLLAAWV